MESLFAQPAGLQTKSQQQSSPPSSSPSSSNNNSSASQSSDLYRSTSNTRLNNTGSSNNGETAKKAAPPAPPPRLDIKEDTKQQATAYAPTANFKRNSIKTCLANNLILNIRNAQQYSQPNKLSVEATQINAETVMTPRKHYVSVAVNNYEESELLYYNPIYKNYNNSHIIEEQTDFFNIYNTIKFKNRSNCKLKL